jgi:hypothetical protein
MIRVVLINLVFLLLPLVLYYLYIYIRRELQPDVRMTAEAPVALLIGSGVVLMLASLLIFGKWEGNAPGGKYYPPEIRNGVVVPGRVE